jgi:hypothetical protein
MNVISTQLLGSWLNRKLVSTIPPATTNMYNFSTIKTWMKSRFRQVWKCSKGKPVINLWYFFIMLIIEDETHFLFHCQINLKLRELTDNIILKDNNNGENKIKFS